jgi:hypothetical protein
MSPMGITNPLYGFRRIKVKLSGCTHCNHRRTVRMDLKDDKTKPPECSSRQYKDNDISTVAYEALIWQRFRKLN